MVELADTYVSEAYALRHGGSSPLPGTNNIERLTPIPGIKCSRYQRFAPAENQYFSVKKNILLEDNYIYICISGKTSNAKTVIFIASFF